MATYNHAPYVAESIRSVLDQTFADFEFLIADDGSSDETASIVAQFDDPRIVFVANADNRGSGTRRNELIERSRADYIAVQNSDDWWPRDKLAQQFAFMEANPQYGATFGDGAYVDANGTPLWTDRVSPFRHTNRPPGQWLRHLFAERNNCFCHPTVLMRRACHAEVGFYDSRLSQRPDVELWVRLLKKYPVHVSENVLCVMRWHGANESNTNAEDVRARWLNECDLIAEKFFAGMSKDLLVEGFVDLMVFKNPPSDTHCEIEKALIYLRCGGYFEALYKVIGLRKLYALFASPQHQAILASDYGIEHRALQALSAEAQAFRQAFDLPAAEEQIRARETRIAGLERMSAQRDTEIASVRSVTAAREAQIAALQRTADEREAELVALRGSTAERIAALEQSAATLQEQNADLREQIAHRQRQIAALLGSTSWRLTAPMRLARRLIRPR
jgi:glycosyltransferase involved in cell wall biosynthesis